MDNTDTIPLIDFVPATTSTDEVGNLIIGFKPPHATLRLVVPAKGMVSLQAFTQEFRGEHSEPGNAFPFPFLKALWINVLEFWPVTPARKLTDIQSLAISLAGELPLHLKSRHVGTIRADYAEFERALRNLADSYAQDKSMTVLNVTLPNQPGGQSRDLSAVLGRSVSEFLYQAPQELTEDIFAALFLITRHFRPFGWQTRQIGTLNLVHETHRVTMRSETDQPATQRLEAKKKTSDLLDRIVAEAPPSLLKAEKFKAACERLKSAGMLSS